MLGYQGTPLLPNVREHLRQQGVMLIARTLLVAEGAAELPRLDVLRQRLEVPHPRPRGALVQPRFALAADAHGTIAVEVYLELPEAEESEAWEELHNVLHEMGTRGGLGDSLRLQLLKGESLLVEVQLNATVHMLKLAIELESGIPAAEQGLTYGDRLLQGAELIRVHNVGRDSTVLLMLGSGIHIVGWYFSVPARIPMGSADAWVQDWWVQNSWPALPAGPLLEFAACPLSVSQRDVSVSVAES